MKEVHKDQSYGKGQAIGFPLLYHHELTKDCFAIVMERLGSSLKDIRDQISKKFSMKNVL
jgi:hypothetical protein